jgi:hypothetical protein
MNNKKKIIFVSVILCLLIVAIFLLFGKKKTTTEKEEELKKIKFEDVSFINIRYNNGQDVIVVTKDEDYKVEYSGFDLSGRDILNENGEKKVNNTSLSQDVKDYIVKEVLPNLEEYKNGTTDWYISINTDGYKYTTKRGKRGTEPDWFLTLLKKFNINKYGNMSKQIDY